MACQKAGTRPYLHFGPSCRAGDWEAGTQAWPGWTCRNRDGYCISVSGRLPPICSHGRAQGGLVRIAPPREDCYPRGINYVCIVQVSGVMSVVLIVLAGRLPARPCSHVGGYMQDAALQVLPSRSRVICRPAVCTYNCMYIYRILVYHIHIHIHIVRPGKRAVEIDTYVLQECDGCPRRCKPTADLPTQTRKH